MATPASSYTMLIDGKSVSAAATFGVRNPATEDIFSYAPAADADDLERAVNAATRAFPAWRDLPIAKRKKTLLAAADIIDQHATELAALLTS